MIDVMQAPTGSATGIFSSFSLILPENSFAEWLRLGPDRNGLHKGMLRSIEN
jgi:hypothetical protein